MVNFFQFEVDLSILNLTILKLKKILLTESFFRKILIPKMYHLIYLLKELIHKILKYYYPQKFGAETKHITKKSPVMHFVTQKD